MTVSVMHGAHAPGAGHDGPEHDACSAAEHASDEFRMFHFKVLPCCKTASHDWLECVYSHVGEKATRRCPKTYNYTAVACPDVRKAGRCPRGDACPYAHSTFEYWLHPTRYRTQLCSFGASCRRSVCFFAHSIAELRTPTLADGTPTAPLPSGPASTNSSSTSTFNMIMKQEQQHKHTQLQHQLQRLLVQPGLSAADLMAPPLMQPLPPTPALPAPAFADLLALHQQQHKQQQLWGQDARQQRDQEALMARLANGLRMLEQNQAATLRREQLQQQMEQQQQQQPFMAANIWAPSPSTASPYLPQDSHVMQLAAAMASSHLGAQPAAAHHRHEQQQMRTHDPLGHLPSSSSTGSSGLLLQDSLLRALSGISADSSSGSSSSGSSYNGDGGSLSGNNCSPGSNASSTFSQMHPYYAAPQPQHTVQSPLPQHSYLPASFFSASPYAKPTDFQQTTSFFGSAAAY